MQVQAKPKMRKVTIRRYRPELLMWIEKEILIPLNEKPKLERKRIHISFTSEELKLVFKALETLKEAIRNEQKTGYEHADELAKLYELMIHIKAVLEGKCRGRRKRIDHYSPLLEDYLKNEGLL